MENQIHNPTSEVGSVPTPAFSEDQWRTIMELKCVKLCKRLCVHKINWFCQNLTQI